MRTPDAGQIRAANQRGAAMTLAAAAEYAIITTGKQAPHPGAPGPGKLSSRERELITLVAQARPTPRSPASCSSASAPSAPT